MSQRGESIQGVDNGALASVVELQSPPRLIHSRHQRIDKYDWGKDRKNQNSGGNDGEEGH